MSPRTDINIHITTETLRDHFLISPNELHRGEGEYQGLTLHERGMLAALLTLPATHRTSRAGIEALAPELGRDKISSILRGLREKRFVYTRRFNVGGGKFTWQWRVYLRRQAPGFDPFAIPTITDVPTIDGVLVDGPDVRKQAISPGHTIDASSGPQETSLKEEVPTVLEVPKEPPHPRPVGSEPAPPAPTASGGEDPTNLDEAITAALRHQPTWRRVAVAAAVRQAIGDGLPPDVAYRTIVDIAEGTRYGPTHAGPQRIVSRGPWWSSGAVFIPAAAPAMGDRCPTHQGQPARSCACCASESLGRDEPAAVTIPPAAPAPDDARALLAKLGLRSIHHSPQQAGVRA
jgi:hypothetical protein